MFQEILEVCSMLLNLQEAPGKFRSHQVALGDSTILLDVRGCRKIQEPLGVSRVLLEPLGISRTPLRIQDAPGDCSRHHYAHSCFIRLKEDLGSLEICRRLQEVLWCSKRLQDIVQSFRRRYDVVGSFRRLEEVLRISGSFQEDLGVFRKCQEVQDILGISRNFRMIQRIQEYLGSFGRLYDALGISRFQKDLV